MAWRGAPRASDPSDLTAILVTAAVATGPAPADLPAGPVRTEGDCQRVAAFVPMDADRARAYVPDGFANPGEAAGIAC